MTTKTLLTGLLAGGVLLLLGAPSTAHAKAMRHHAMRHHAKVMHHMMRHHTMARHTTTRTRPAATAAAATHSANATNTEPRVTPSPGVSNVGTVTHGVGTAGNLGRRTTTRPGTGGRRVRSTVPVPGSGVGTTTSPASH